MRTASLAVASCLALAGAPSTALAAGLGKIVVFSALGQPLRAEIEVVASREELSDMRAKLAPEEAFKQAGLDYATTLLGIKFSLSKGSNGQAVVKLTSDAPINDPFIDMLLELNWPTGRLVREYTFLLDPPDMLVKSPAPVATVQSKPVVGKSSAATTIDDDVRSRAMARVRGQAAPAKAAAPAVASSAEAHDASAAHEVKRGETLRKIASETKPEGVSLEQMLVGLLRANQDAFDGGNMNRLKAGRILTVPDKAAVEAIPAAEARKVVIAQSSDWNSYRNKLAGVAAQTAASDDAGKQESTGKITAKVEDKAAPAAEAKDQVKVSKTDTGGAKTGAGAAAHASDEDLIAKDKALKEANERLGALEKNLTDLQKLVELKNQNLADLQKQAAAKSEPAPETKAAAPAAAAAPAPAPAVAVTTPPAPAAAPAEAAADKPAVPASEQKAPEAAASAAKVEEPKAEEPKPAEAPPAAPKAKPKPAAPQPEPEEPGFIDGLLDNALPLAGGLAVLALGGAYLVARRRRAGKEEVPLTLGNTLTPASASLTGNSVFRSTGGQSVDTTSHTPAQTDFSQAGPGSIDTDEVDPVAEADVYMAYGRDAQAEEILLEARQKDPKRLAIHLKLLEIYANRKDLKQFETLATDLYSETGGVGADWDKAAALGLRLDPANPLYGGSSEAKAAFDADATVIVSSQSIKNTITMPGELSQLAEDVASPTAVEPVTAAAAPASEVLQPVAELANLDFDLGSADSATAPASAVVDAAEAEEAMADGVPDDLVQTAPEAVNLNPAPLDEAPLDFDLGGASAEPVVDRAGAAAETGNDLDFSFPDLAVPAVAPAAQTADTTTDLDFDLGLGFDTPASGGSKENLAAEPISAPMANIENDDGVEFDVSLTESTFLGHPAPEPSGFDMSSIDLDLNVPDIFVTPPSTETAESAFEAQQVATAVNPDFSVESDGQLETMVNPEFVAEPPADMLPEQDFAFAQAETQLASTHQADAEAPAANTDFTTTQEATVVNPQFEESADLLPDFEVSPNEEVATKLDLAKAYEEMGDFEGASELLQEVLKEGDTAQKEKAQAILTKINR